MIVSGIVLIFVFILTLVFGILRIIKSTSHQTMVEDITTDVSNSTSSEYVVAEDVVGLVIELLSILFAILGTFVLYRYVKSKYGPVATTEPDAAAKA